MVTGQNSVLSSSLLDEGILKTMNRVSKKPPEKDVR
jgi:hypothetical protein